MTAVIDEDMFTGEATTDPYGYYGRLRDEDPVHWNKKYELWVITRYDDLVWLTRHNELFSSEYWQRDAKSPYPELDESDLGLYQQLREYLSESFVRQDRPVHTERRGLVERYFTPKAVEMWRPMVASVIDDLLDMADQTGRMDVMRDFAAHIPLLIISQMMCIPHQDRPFIRSLAEKVLFFDRGESERMGLISEGIKGLIEYLSSLVEEVVSNPPDEDNLLSLLANGEKSGVLTRDGVVGNAISLLMASHITTTDLICNGTLAFIQHQHQWKLLKQRQLNDASTVIRATEECLRYDPPIKSIQRAASEDVEIRGKVLRKNDRIRWIISSANRDPEKFVDPDEFDISRWPNAHLAFGFGIHRCLGTALARLEGQEVFKALARRYDSISLETDEVEYEPSIAHRSIKTLPVSLN